MKFVPIRAGEFLMGSPAHEEGRKASETPHRVVVSKPFWMQTTAVTMKQWTVLMEARDVGSMLDDLPVSWMSWNDVQAFISRLNEKGKEDGVVYRLPTEAEWEYACRAGTQTRFHSGDAYEDLGDVAWHSRNSSGSTHPVAVKKPNAFGLYDMHGNVWEWCSDWWYEWYYEYEKAPVKDPRGPAYGGYRVLRGGSCKEAPGVCRSANRCFGDPAECLDRATGFRLVAVPSAVVSEPSPAQGPLGAAHRSAVSGASAPSRRAIRRGGGNRFSVTDEIPRAFTNVMGMKFAPIPAGTFRMGSECHEEKDPDADETPHEVTLSKAFWMQLSQVTQKQWTAVMGHNPSGYKGDDLPVETVSWNDAQNFLMKLNDLEKSEWFLYRLPTEAEWEYACRAGRRLPCDAESLYAVAWYRGSSNDFRTKPVGTKKPNAWGLYDMLGNVSEWCSDWYGPYVAGPVTDPQGPATGSRRVTRGGDFGSGPGICRPGYRWWADPLLACCSLGFRVVAERKS